MWIKQDTPGMDMKRVLVIADDLTGAAEIAGIGWRFGLAARVVRDEPLESGSVGDGMTVIDTDSRSLAPEDARERVRTFVGKVITEVTTPEGGGFDLIYKKTDSVLRGPVGAELEALMEAVGVEAVVLVPQNPSRGRTIVKGEYRIDGVPLDRTGFAEDPEHPARTADVVELVGRGGGVDVRCLEAGEVSLSDNAPPSPSPSLKGRGVAIPAYDDPSLQHGINIGAGGSMEDVRLWASQVGQGVLAAGGADFFEAVLGKKGLREVAQGGDVEVGEGVLFVCGSASRREELIERARERGVGVCGMPDEVFGGIRTAGSLREPLVRLEVERWCEGIVRALEEGGRAVVVVPQAVDRSEGVAQGVQAGLAEVVACVLGRRAVDHLLLEGGSTATAVCRRMGWRELEVEGEVAAGVVQMRASMSGQRLVVKPGSYAWPEVVWGG